MVCLSVCHDREPCKYGWTNLGIIWDVDSGGPKEQFWGWIGRRHAQCPYVSNSWYTQWLSRGSIGKVQMPTGVYSMGSHWHNLANTTEPSVCGGDVALCQITYRTCYYHLHYYMPSMFWYCWLGIRKSIWPVKTWVMRCWHGCLSVSEVQINVLHMVQILSPIFSCFIKIQNGLTFVVPAYPGCPGKEAIK